MWQQLEIEDDSDCETCTERQHGILEHLAANKCYVLSNVQCRECGREHNIWISEENDDGDS